MEPEVVQANMLRLMYKLDIIDWISLDAYIDVLQVRLFERL